MKDNTNSGVDYRAVAKEIWKRRKIYYKVLPATFILAFLYIICIPRLYFSETKVAPELEGPSTGGTLSSLASSFGFDLSDMQSTDAITPLLYPDLLNDNGFVAELFGIKVKSKDNKINTDLCTYFRKHQKHEWWNTAIWWVQDLFKKKDNGGKSRFNPYFLSRNDTEVMSAIRDAIKIKVDKKTSVITISTRTQDPLISKTLADSVRGHLQQFITRYRTNKARIDYEYYKKLAADAKHEYERARQRYGSYADANTDAILVSFKSKQDDLENEMQLRYNAYSTINTQLQAAKAKIQERTPAFTLVQGAAVPIKAEYPKRMLFVLGMVVLAFIITSLYTLRDIVLPKSND